MDSSTPTFRRSNKKLLPILGSFVFLAIIAIIAAIVVIGGRKGPEDTRSQASQAANPSLSIMQTRKDGSSREFEVLYDGGAQANEINISSFDMQLSISPQDQKVLGLTTPPNAKNEMTAAERKRRTIPTPTSVPITLVMPCYDVAIDGTTPSWPNSCRGIPGRTSCQGASVPLTSDEVKRYEVWKKFGKPQVPGCGVNATPLAVASSTPQATSVPFFTDQKLSFSSELGNIITFDKPTVTFDSTTQSYRMRVSGKVVRDKDAQQTLVTRKKLFTITLSDVKPEQVMTATIIAQSIKGAYAITPNAELELTAKPTPSPVSPSGTASATPKLP